MNLQLVIPTENDIEDIAAQVAEYVKAEKVVLFHGSMGAGKTTFIRSLVKQLGSNDEVSSPTFSIVNEYAYPKGSIYHFDFYRIENEEEAYDIGFEEYLYSDEICLIEWPERVSGLLPDDVLEIEIVAQPDDSRILNLTRA